MKLEVLPTVWPEFLSSAEWYEMERRGLAADLLDEAAATVDRIESGPLLFPVIYRDARRAQLHRFPFGMFFTYKADHVVIFCIMHLRRDESVWKSHLPNS